MKMRRQTRKHFEAGVIVKFANNSTGSDSISHRAKLKRRRPSATFAVDLDQIDLRDPDFAQDII